MKKRKSLWAVLGILTALGMVLCACAPEEIPYAENDERKIVEDICKQENITCRYSEKGFNFGEE